MLWAYIHLESSGFQCSIFFLHLLQELEASLCQRWNNLQILLLLHWSFHLIFVISFPYWIFLCLWKITMWLGIYYVLLFKLKLGICFLTDFNTLLMRDLFFSHENPISTIILSLYLKELFNSLRIIIFQWNMKLWREN